MNNEAQSRLPEWVSKPAVRIAAGAVALGGSLAGCGGDDAGDVDPGFTPNPAHTLTVEPPATSTPIIEVTSTPTATPTLEPTAIPTTPPTPERVQDVPCSILPQEFCDDAEVVDYTGPAGEKLTLLGFILPAGTKITAIGDGTLYPVTFGKSSPWKGAGASLQSTDGSKRISFIGDISINSTISRGIKSGTEIGVINAANIVNLDRYNLLIGFGRIENGVTSDDLELMEQLFPGITSITPQMHAEQTQLGVVQALPHFKCYDQDNRQTC